MQDAQQRRLCCLLRPYLLLAISWPAGGRAVVVVLPQALTVPIECLGLGGAQAAEIQMILNAVGDASILPPASFQPAKDRKLTCLVWPCPCPGIGHKSKLIAPVPPVCLLMCRQVIKGCSVLRK